MDTVAQSLGDDTPYAFETPIDAPLAMPQMPVNQEEEAELSSSDDTADSSVGAETENDSAEEEEDETESNEAAKEEESSSEEKQEEAKEEKEESEAEEKAEEEGERYYTRCSPCLFCFVLFVLPFREKQKGAERGGGGELSYVSR